jgi:hypothetical protein
MRSVDLYAIAPVLSACPAAVGRMLNNRMRATLKTFGFFVGASWRGSRISSLCDSFATLVEVEMLWICSF